MTVLSSMLMLQKQRLLPVVALLAGLAMTLHAPVAVSADTVRATPGEELHKKPAKQGWFWYLDPKEEEEPPPSPPAPKVVVPPPKKTGPVVVIPKKVDAEQLCKEKDTWSAKCGFVDPGDDFDFQAKQRDILLQQMAMRPDVPEAVEAAQRYMKWVVGRASMAANMWYFNMVQNPELDPTVKNPISEVGIALASRVTEASQYEYFKLIREEGGVLFFFTREDCQFCHDQAAYARRVAKTMGLQLINLPLDGKCLEGFAGEDCADNIPLEKVAILNVNVVPAIFLYVPSNTWIRLGTGIVADSVVLANTVNFFSAYRAAMLHGLDNSSGARPTVTFDPKHNAKATGVATENGKGQLGAPTQTDMMKLLGYTPEQARPPK